MRCKPIQISLRRSSMNAVANTPPVGASAISDVVMPGKTGLQRPEAQRHMPTCFRSISRYLGVFASGQRGTARLHSSRRFWNRCGEGRVNHARRTRKSKAGETLNLLVIRNTTSGTRREPFAPSAVCRLR
jgi:hypothetical protein